MPTDILNDGNDRTIACTGVADPVEPNGCVTGGNPVTLVVLRPVFHQLIRFAGRAEIPPIVERVAIFTTGIR